LGLLYIGAALRAQIPAMSLLAQLFRHKDARTAEERAVVSLGAVAAAVEWKVEPGSDVPVVAVAASANLPPVGPGGMRRSARVSSGEPSEQIAPPPRVSEVAAGEAPQPKIFATPEEVAAQASPAVLPEPSATEVLAALEFGILNAPIAEAETQPPAPEIAVIEVARPSVPSEPPPTPPSVITSSPAIEIAVAETPEGRPLEVLAAWESPVPQEPAVAAASHSAAPENAVAAAAAEQSPVTSHQSPAPSEESARAAQTERVAAVASAAPVILAPRVMHLAPGEPTPVFLVPAGFISPVQIERDESGNAAANENAHANH
jgi:hypothetical protein